jgi:choline kinase
MRNPNFQNGYGQRVIILAAGSGSRLRPLTLKKPKPLIKVGKHPIIDHEILSFARNDIKEIHVVVGYKGSAIMRHLSRNFAYPEFETSYVYNPKYNRTNTAYSLWLASPFFSGGINYIINGDLLITPDVVSRIIDCPNSCLGFVRHQCGSEEVKVRLDGNRIIEIGKGLDPEVSDGEYVGIAKIDEKLSSRFRSALDRVIKEGKVNLYYDDVIQELLADSYIEGVDITDLPVMEIDTIDELEVAIKIYEGQ